MKNIANIEFLRGRFDKVLKYYGPKGLAPQLSQIRIEEKLVNGKSNYSFNIKKENLDQCEHNLKRNDLFVVLGIGVFLRSEVVAKPGIAPLETYPGAGFTTKDIEALYNGSLYISTGTTVNIEDMPTALFRVVPEAATEFNFENSLKTMAEEIVFAGTQDHQVKVSFPNYAASDFSGAEGVENRLVFVAYGYRVVGGTNEQYRNDPANPYKGCL